MANLQSRQNLQNLQSRSGDVAFVNSVTLAEPRYSLPSTFENRIVAHTPDKTKSAHINGGSVVAFTDSVTGPAKQDILNSTLLAQLASDHKYDREKETEAWYSHYKFILGNIGYVIENFQFEQHNSQGSSFKMDEVVLEILAAIATGGESEIILATLAAMKAKSDGDKKIHLFEQHSSHDNAGNFQISPCNQGADGEVSLTLGTFYFKSDRSNVNFLFFEWAKESIRLYKGAQKVVLNSQVYEKVRSAVASKLGDKAVSLVAEIEIWVCSNNSWGL